MLNYDRKPLPKNWRELIIVKLRPNNPRKKYTHGWYSWETYYDGMPTDEYAKGKADKRKPIHLGKRFHYYTGAMPNGYPRHLHHDYNQGWINLVPKK